MKARWLLHGLKVLVFVVLAVVAIGSAVMLLWNALLPELFGLPAIGFLQAVGLLVLARILLGGFRGRWGHGGRHGRARLIERWENMSDEERAQFRAGMQRGCGRGRGRRADPPEQQTQTV